ncbi:MAG: PAS domain-containing protein [Elainella sp. Prado103]|jgi:PAS domain S-box-containing protein|nr:PAS domain-containing protein [Elainella sp. Prado103]
MRIPTILCVDDEHNVLLTLRAQLQRQFPHYTIEIAESGVEALALVDELWADGGELSLVIADQIMPGMGGDELLIELHARYPQILKVMLTGQASPEAVGNVVNRGSLYRFLPKPWDEADLNLTVAEAMRRYQQEQRLSQQQQILEQANRELVALNADLERQVQERTQQLRSSERQFQIFVEHTPAAVAMLDREMRYLLASRRWREDYQLGEQEIIGRSHYEVFPTIPDRWKEVHQRCLAGAIERAEEDSFEREDGSITWNQWEVRPWYTDQHEIGGIIMLTQVLTDRKRTEIALRQSEASLAAAQRIAHLGNWEFELATQKVRWSEELFSLYGRDSAQWQPTYTEFQQQVHPEDWPPFEQAIQAAIQQGTPYTIEHRVFRPDGVMRYALSKGEAVRNAQGQVMKLFGTTQDITELKQTELALLQRETQLQAIAANIPGGVFRLIYHADGSHTCPFASEGYRTLFGVDPQFLQTNPSVNLQWVHPDDRQIYLQAAEQAMMQSNDSFYGEVRYCLPSGQVKWIATTAQLRREENGDVIVDGIDIDITAQKVAEAALQRSEEQLRLALDFGQIAIWDWDVASGELVWNETSYRLLGYQPGAVAPTYDTWLQAVHPEDRERSHQAIVQALSEQRDFSIEYRVVWPDGSLRWISDAGRGIYNADHQVVRAVGVMLDITQQKQAEAQIRQSEQQLQATLNFTGIGAWSWHPVTGEYAWNGKMQELLELPLGLDNMFQVWRDRIHPDDVDRVVDHIQKALETRSSFTEEYRYNLNGRIVWRWVRGQAIYTETGAIERVLGVLQDITDRKQVEDSLRQSEAKQSALIRALPDLIMRVSQDGMYLDFLTTSIFKVLGDRTTVVGTYVWETLPPDLAERRMNAIQTALRTGEIQIYEQELWIEQGWQTEECRVVVCGDREVLIIGRDITDRKRAEAALEESEERRRLALDLTETGSWEFEVGSGIAIWSDSHYRLMGLEPGELPSCYQTWRDRVHPEDLDWVEQAFTQALETHSPLEVEYRVVHPDGTVRWVLTKGQGIYNSFNQPIRMLGVMMDVSGRKQTEIALKLSQERLETLVNALPFAVWVRDSSDRVVLQNVVDMTHYGDQLGTHIDQIDQFDQIDQIDQFDQFNGTAEWKSQYHRVKAQYEIGEFFTIETVEQINGQEHFLLRITAPLPDIDGGKGMFGVAVDITDRKRAELALQQLNEELELRVQRRTEDLQQVNRQLRDSEARFQTFMDHSPTSAWINDMAGMMVYCNQTYCRTFQLPTLEVVGQSIFELYPLEVAQQFLSHVQTVMATNQVLETVEYCTRLDGTWGDFLVYKFPIPDSSGQCLIGGVAIDITDRNQAEAALRDSEERLRLALTAANQGLYDLNPKTGEAIVSPEYATMLGYDPETFRETNARWLERLHPDDRRSVAEVYRSYIAGEIPNYQVEFRQRTQDNQWRWILALGKIVAWDESGQPLRMLGTHTDIHERKQLEQELRQINAELEHRVDERTNDLRQAMEAAEAANRAKSTFLTNMSHELRTPLNAILGFSQLLNREDALLPEQRQKINIINRSGEHLLNLINDILEMSKIEAGRVTMTMSHFDLLELLNGLQELFRLKAEAKGLDLRMHIAAETPQYIQADESKLRQVLTNLLSNAIKFTPQGHVLLNVQAVSKSEPQIVPAQGAVPHSPLDQPDHCDPDHCDPDYCDPDHCDRSITLHFAVEDTGPGIHWVEQTDLFEPFVQTRAGQKSQEGTGLGLPISRRFVQLMGGDLVCSSIYGQGATFSFQIPVTVVSASQLFLPDSSRQVIGLAADQPGYRVLVVEDQLENRLFLVQLLQIVGFEVEQAANGQEAVTQYQQWNPDLIWMDMRMPVMDGYEAIRQIRTLSGQTHSPKIIALTASAFDDDRAAILSTGCDDFVHKPVTEAVLFEKMAEHLGVGYLYAEQSETSAGKGEADRSTPTISVAALQTMPLAWIEQLQWAARIADDEIILQLIDQLPPSQVALADALKGFVYEMHLDKLIELTQHVTAGDPT